MEAAGCLLNNATVVAWIPRWVRQGREGRWRIDTEDQNVMRWLDSEGRVGT